MEKSRVRIFTFTSATIGIVLSQISLTGMMRPKPTATDQQEAESVRYLSLCPIADGFVFPVGPPDAQGYYNAQPFGTNDHLGEDWNGIGGGNSDLGDAIHAIGKGIVFYVGDPGPGWGNVVRLCHNIGSRENPKFVESLYGHLKTVDVAPGDIVEKGQRLGSMGNVDGLYHAHLHLEVRTEIGMSIGGGYAKNKTGFTEPTKFIKLNRKRSRQNNAS